MLRQILLGLTLVLAVSIISTAQPKDGNPSQSKTSKEKTARDLEAERLLKERRANAQSLLITLATDARNFTDQTAQA